jgi:putative ABC transport system permease protein
VTPIKILVSNCRASLDVLTFRGIPPERVEDLVLRDGGRIVAGSVEEWRRRTDAALLGRRVAERRRLKVGDRFTIAGITVFVAGVFDSSNVQHQNAAYTHLDFLQRASGFGLGTVTQFNVKVDDPERMTQVAAAIDAEFRNAQDPTATWGEKAFTARAMTDIVELVRFAALLGWGALAAVFALVANAILLSVQERIRDHAVLQTLGFGRRLIIELIVAESTLVSVLGGVFGIALAAVTLHIGKWTFSVEGTSVHFHAGGSTIFYGLVLCVGIGVLAGLAPAWQAGRRTITDCFRAV